jgi:hypothetical protein
VGWCRERGGIPLLVVEGNDDEVEKLRWPGILLFLDMLIPEGTP